MSFYRALFTARKTRRVRDRRQPYGSERSYLPNVGATVNPFALIWS